MLFLLYLCFQLNTLMTDINAFISQLMLILMNLIFFFSNTNATHFVFLNVYHRVFGYLI